MEQLLKFFSDLGADKTLWIQFSLLVAFFPIMYFGFIKKLLERILKQKEEIEGREKEAQIIWSLAMELKEQYQAELRKNFQKNREEFQKIQKDLRTHEKNELEKMQQEQRRELTHAKALLEAQEVGLLEQLRKEVPGYSHQLMEKLQ